MGEEPSVSWLAGNWQWLVMIILPILTAAVGWLVGYKMTWSAVRRAKVSNVIVVLDSRGQEANQGNSKVIAIKCFLSFQYRNATDVKLHGKLQLKKKRHWFFFSPNFALGEEITTETHIDVEGTGDWAWKAELRPISDVSFLIQPNSIKNWVIEFSIAPSATKRMKRIGTFEISGIERI